MKFNNTRVMNFEGAIRGMRNPKNSWNRSDSYFGIVDSYNNPGFEVVEAWAKKEKPELYKSDATIEQENEKIDLEDKYDDWLVKNGILKTCEDSIDGIAEIAYLGPNDLTLMQTLIKAGSEHRKFMRQIFVSVDITAPLYWWKEFDTYKVGTVANSTSTMHKLAETPITLECFETDDMPDYFFMSKELRNSKVYYEAFINWLEELRLKYLETNDKRYWKELIRWLPESWLQTRTVTMSYENLFSIVFHRGYHKLKAEWCDGFIKWCTTLPYAKELIFYGEEREKIYNLYA